MFGYFPKLILVKGGAMEKEVKGRGEGEGRMQDRAMDGVGDGGGFCVRVGVGVNGVIR